MFSEHDVIKQLVELLAEAIRRALRLAKSARKDEAIALLQSATGELLGVEFTVLEMLDAPTAVKTLGSAARVDAYVQLLTALAQLDGEPWRTRAAEVDSARQVKPLRAR